jgi:protein pelota
MKQLGKTKEEMKVKVENLDDLWYLSQIIDQGDLVKGKTVRKIKIGEEDQRKQKVVKKSIFIEVKVEKVEFSKTTDVLRIGGVITQVPDDISKGEHHTFNIEENTTITIKKERWLQYQIDKIKDACSTKVSKILICCFDREEAYFALMKKQGYSLLSSIKGEVQKKAEEQRITKNFYSEIINQLKNYSDKYKITSIILASPAFWKEELMKELKDDDLKRKIIQATCSAVGKTAINEVLKRDEIKRVLHDDRITKEINLVEELLFEIKNNGQAVYGLKETENAANAGAVRDLLVTDSLIQKARQEDNYERIEAVMKITESTKGSVNLVSSEHAGGKKLDGLGGIAAILRYKLNY